jgi:hypothetical protein
VAAAGRITEDGELMLTQQDRKWWGPVAAVHGWLERSIPKGALVLDIGPGSAPFWRADAFVDFDDSFNIPRDKFHKCDVGTEPLPFPDKSFDFVYCRHVLEDCFDPFRLCREISRVGKAGYLETPSPIVELCRGADGGSPAYRGYHHHRWVIWNKAGQLCFVTKYPFIEYLKIAEPAVEGMLRGGPNYWNTYLHWENEINFRHLQNGIDFFFWDRFRYADLLAQAVTQSKESSDAFWNVITPPAAVAA